MYLCLSIQPSSLLALSQFCSAHEPKVATNTLTTGSVFPHSLPGGWQACSSQHCQPSPEIDPDWRSIGHIPNPNQSLESGGWIGLIFMIFSTFKLRNSSFPLPHWLSRGNRALPGRGKVEIPAWKVINSCHHPDHCYPGTLTTTAQSGFYPCPHMGLGNT